MATLSKEEKGALLLKSLAPEVVDTVLARLGPERGNRMRALMQRLSPEASPQDALDQVLREVEALLLAQDAGVKKEERQDTHTAATEPAATPDIAAEDAEWARDPLAALTRLEGEQLALALQGENPRTVSLLLNYLAVDRAGDVFKRLPAELRREVSVQFSSCTVPSVEVMQRIAQGILRKTRLLKETPKGEEPEVRYRKMADMIRLLEKADRKEVLTALEERDAAAAAAVKTYLYKFEDLLRIDSRAMQKFLAELDTKNLALALKGAAAEIKDKILSNMSQRARETLNEEIEFSTSVSAAQVEQARKLIVDTIQRLDQSGELTLGQE